MEGHVSPESVLAGGKSRPFAFHDGIGAVPIGHFNFVKTVRLVDLDDSADGLDGGTLRHGMNDDQSVRE